MQHADVLIVGGGPAGSTTASAVRLLGLRAIVLEKDVFPRFHIGESLLPQSLKIFRRIGVLDKLEANFIRKYGARFVCGETARTAQYDFEEAFDPSVPYAFQVPRADFDHLLLLHAAELGTDVRHEWEVLGAIEDEKRVVGVRARDAKGTVHELFAPITVDASGRDTLFASKVRTKTRLPGLDKTALFGHFHGVPRRKGRDEGAIDIVTFPHGWFWNIPFRGEVNSTGAVVSAEWMKERRTGESLDAFFERTVETAPWMKELLQDAKRILPCRALADFSYRVDAFSGDGWVMAGDASGFIDPLFSTGVHLAFSSAILAADVIAKVLGEGRAPAAADFAGYERTVRRGAELFVGAVQAFYSGALRDRVFETDQRQILRRTITSMLAGDVFSDSAWVGFLRDHYPAQLPGIDGEMMKPGASPVLS
jgi:flavin-dependent dehydrogenase